MTTAIAAAVDSFAQSLAHGSIVLDVGCGLRPYEKFFQLHKYVGLDVAVSGRHAVDKSADVLFDGLNIPFSAESIDALICTEVLEHAVDAEGLLGEMARVLRPGGQVLITVPFIWGLHELPYDFRRYTDIGLRNAVTKAGLTVISEGRLTSGIDAIAMLVASELNNYRVNVRPLRTFTAAQNRRYRWADKIQECAFRALIGLWRKHFEFARVYLDNLVIARKS